MIIVNFMQVKLPLTSVAVPPKKGSMIQSNIKFYHFHCYLGAQRYHTFPCLYIIFGHSLLNEFCVASYPNNGRRTSTNFKMHILHML